MLSCLVTLIPHRYDAGLLFISIFHNSINWLLFVHKEHTHTLTLCPPSEMSQSPNTDTVDDQQHGSYTPATSPEPGLLDPLAFRKCIIEYAEFAEVPDEPICPLNAKLLSFICCLWVSKWRFP